MAKFELKKQAIALRKHGKSLKEIVKLLHVSKSTVSLWCREVELSNKQKEFLYKKMVSNGHEGRIRGAEANKQKKRESLIRAREEAIKISKDISVRDALIAGIALYWAEGSKAPSTSGFLFVNSDPIMIHFMHNWLVSILKVPKNEIRPMLSINHIHIEREEIVLNFWSNLLDLPRNQFSRTFFMKTAQKKVYENHEHYYGVLRIGVRRSSFLKYKILALIDILKAGVAQVVRANAS